MEPRGAVVRRQRRRVAERAALTTPLLASARALRTAVAIAVRAVSGLIVVTFVALTAIYNMPVNPLKIELQPLVASTIGTYFVQNWSLFAPNPVFTDYIFLVHPLTREQAAIFAERDVLPAAGWVDLSTPLWAHFQENRFSAYDRLARPQTNGIRDYLGGSIALIPFSEACTKGDTGACGYVARQRELSRSWRGPFLTRIASAYCNGLAIGDACAYVALRARITFAVPWSERGSGTPRVQEVDLGVFPADRSSRPSGVFTAGG
ncbi:MAG: hypothetical protein AUH85_09080 [Chloroflexi bacterium 13_1_40CM_4_68_4]|nr:MAG: hypothetical protein AUH85_09080 [Chloroflexi bacterium 13_1_40CM_4_68_4]